MTGLRPNRSAMEPPKREIRNPVAELIVINVDTVARRNPRVRLMWMSWNGHAKLEPVELIKTPAPISQNWRGNAPHVERTRCINVGA